MNTTAVSRHPDAGKPWWKFPIVWMVVGGPLAVVVAALVTVGIAVNNVDPVLDTKAGAQQRIKASELPAVQGRNKAAENSTLPAQD